MGWKLSDKCLTCDGTGTREYETGDTLDGRDCPWCGGTGKRPTYIVDNKYWNPYTSWEDCHTVLDKVMEDEELATKFWIKMLLDHGHNGKKTIPSVCILMAKASKETLMDTLCQLLSEQDE